MLKFLLGGFLAAAVGLSASADVKVAVVDTGKAFDVYYKTKAAATKIAAKEAKFKKEIQDLQVEYQQSSQEAQNLETAAKDTTLSTEVRKTKDGALALKVQDLKSIEDELTQMNRERTTEIRDDLLRSHAEISEQIVKTIDDYASRLGYDLVLDSSMDSASTQVSRMPYHSVKVFDITERIISMLNASAPPDVPPADSGRKAH